MLRFGTDGIRGVANVELTPELVLALGRAAARVLGGDTFAVGRDTRCSSEMLQAALSAGLTAEGIEQVVDLGVVPTPGVAHMAAAHEWAGAMISASHNPWTDNGVKFFNVGGRKLTDEQEERLEAELDAAARSTTANVGEIYKPIRGAQQYVDHLLEVLEGRSLKGLSVVLDCANGAASDVAAEVFSRLGATVRSIAFLPDGTNINEGCGSTHPETLQAAVVEHEADLGLAFDGDADRVLAVDHRGRLVDGDHLIALCALDLQERGRLKDDTVVVTVMTNLGFRLAMAERGIRVHETQVGDRYVLEALDANGWSLGGEQSGHVIFRDLATTGDGILTGLQVADLVLRSGRRLAELADAAMTRLPQVLRNVRVADRDGLALAHELWDEVAEVEAELGDHGRVLLRPSGTEPVVRVMVEAPTAEQAEAAARRLSDAVARACGA
ncbi:MAG TPA: phosphoglucosamine mutase [Acidimicrobiales bacterium]|nr:phosphoglucosamine mutase [Acidimicrobiales bacterium]